MLAHLAPPYTGRVVVRLIPSVVDAIAQWARTNGTALATLGEVASQLHVDSLQSLVARYSQLPSQRAVSNASAVDILALEEAAGEGPLPPQHSLVGYYIIDPRGLLGPEEAQRLLRDLESNQAVELAYLETMVRDAAITPEDEGAYPARYKGHFDGNHVGINARSPKVWGVCDGTGIGLVDLEAGWNLNHEDLPSPPPPVYNLNRPVGNHGTAVLGIIVGADNGKGIVGLAPGATVLKLVSHIKPTSALFPAMDQWDVAGAIVDALTSGLMKPGDVLLIEVEALGSSATVGYPVEIVALWFDAVRLAASQMVVVEAAGNGDGVGVGRDLDAWQDAATARKLSRRPTEDSGAILVSACASAVHPAKSHRRMDFANYGTRVDCYAWGQQVYTAGGDGNLTPGEPNINRWYTKGFGGTSAASAIIAGAAILLQCLALLDIGNRLTPSQMRKLLSDPTTGTAVVTAGGQLIGVMPDLVKILVKLPSLAQLAPVP